MNSRVSNNTNTARDSCTFSQADESAGTGLFDFDYLLLSDSSVNNDRSDCDSMFETTMMFSPTKRASMNNIGITITTLQTQ